MRPDITTALINAVRTVPSHRARSLEVTDVSGDATGNSSDMRLHCRRGEHICGEDLGLEQQAVIDKPLLWSAKSIQGTAKLDGGH